MEWSPADRSPGRNYHFMTSAVAPRPIAWITTIGAADGPTAGIVNLAPFSWFQSVCADPPLVMVAIGERSPGGGLKDTARNIIATGEFVINAATEPLAQRMVASSGAYAPDSSEVDALHIETVPSHAVTPPRVAASPFHLECRLVEHRRYGDTHPTTLIIGEVVHIHADDDVLDERGNIDNARVPLVARLGGIRYLVAKELVEIERPD